MGRLTTACLPQPPEHKPPGELRTRERLIGPPRPSATRRTGARGLGASSAGADQVAPPSAENAYSIWPWPDGCAASNAITRVPCMLSAARYGPAKSKLGNVCPLGQSESQGLAPRTTGRVVRGAILGHRRSGAGRNGVENLRGF